MEQSVAAPQELPIASLQKRNQAVSRALAELDGPTAKLSAELQQALREDDVMGAKPDFQEAVREFLLAQNALERLHAENDAVGTEIAEVPEKEEGSAPETAA